MSAAIGGARRLCFLFVFFKKIRIQENIKLCV